MDKGEGTQLLDQIRQLSEDIHGNLQNIDGRISSLQNEIRAGSSTQEHIMDELTSIRSLIGALEKEDEQEMQDEQILHDMLKKLNDLIEIALK